MKSLPHETRHPKENTMSTNTLTRRLVTCALVALAALVIAAPVGAATLPAVGSGTLVAQFKADASDLVLDGTSGTDVASWTAANDGSIVLTRNNNGDATDNDNLTFDASENGGKGAIVVNDFSGDIVALEGAMPGTRTVSTVFFHGYFSPGRDGSLGDASGQYLYSYGADGADGTQLDLQIDDGIGEIYGGSGTQSFGDITANNDIYKTYRIEYGLGAGDGWAVYIDGALAGSNTNGANFSVSGDLILFAYQNSAGDSSSGYNFVGNVGELLFYDGTLNSTDAAAVEAYLAAPLVVPAPAALPAGIALIVALAARRRRS